MRETDNGYKPIAVALMAAFLLAGCSMLEPLTGKAGAIFETLNIEVKPTPDEFPGDDTG